MSIDKRNELESRFMEIIREAVATSKNPVMLYPLGKDSSGLRHRARKAFWSPPPFPLERMKQEGHL